MRLAEVLQELGLRRLPGSGMMLPDLSDLWAHLESTSRLLSAHGCPGDPQGQGAGRVSFPSFLSPVLLPPTLLSVCLCGCIVSSSSRFHRPVTRGN